MGSGWPWKCVWGGVRQENRVSIVSGRNRHPIFLMDEGGGTVRTCQFAAL